MEDRLLVEALRSRDPAAVGAVYDDYADRLYGYCWFQLRNGDAAQLAFRDTMMCAEVHIRRLRAPAKLGPWLYALARIECRRRRPAGPVHPDIPVARHDQDDVDLRLMAWQAVTALPPLSRELLDLRYRHELAEGDIALVTGLPSREVEELLAQARVLLEAALIVEVLAHEGPFACPERVAILRRRTGGAYDDQREPLLRDSGRAGGIDDDQRELLVRHSLECRLCSHHLPDAISPAKVYTLLPHAAPPESLRARVMSCFTDPEMAGYRLFAATRVSSFGAQGFPEQPGSGRTFAHHRHPSRWPRAIAALAGALLAAVTATAVCGWFGQEASQGNGGIFISPPGARAPLPSPTPPTSDAAARPISATFPLGLREPPSVMGEPGPARLEPGTSTLNVAPIHLTLSRRGTGTLVVHATGGTITWHATTTGPVRLASAGGTLGSGATETVAVQALSHRPGTATITFQPGGRRIQVSWGAPTSFPPQSPTPTSPTTPTPSPTTPPPTPSPSPTASTSSTPPKPPAATSSAPPPPPSTSQTEPPATPTRPAPAAADRPPAAPSSGSATAAS